ncbi:4'-phosphopantetheinyl transferase family protein [Rhizobium rhizogenes]|uniref:4'-phosphopantetheinyl transferase family protein n=1 Tax=Rhizobium rhizogenes TaxID=359 RepID=UPI00080FC6A3|nr:4'-phosphopantetheinyl transferase superfamily protein [Rhizobium rhizogenes]NTI44484.1 4'-phosphopantetheinyl transferase superfamily protein [Rhizobium rhizogenes]OCJ09926.1 phosphopantetheinyl transferase [Agrobacterium sp. B131/95]
MMAKDEVVVWWMRTDDAERHLPQLEALLDDTERARTARFHFQRDRSSYIAAHALGRSLLSTYAGGDPTGWRFTTGDHGKPEVISPHSGPRLRLNLSHTHGLAAAILTLDHDVGIDVEWLDRKPAIDLAEHFFAPAECAHLAAVAPELVHEVFLTFWTLKEAYVKAIGKGLAQPLDSFAFTLDPLSIRFDDELAGDPAHWLLRRFQPTCDHLMALALHHPRPHNVTVTALAADSSLLLSTR